MSATENPVQTPSESSDSDQPAFDESSSKNPEPTSTDSAENQNSERFDSFRSCVTVEHRQVACPAIDPTLRARHRTPFDRTSAESRSTESRSAESGSTEPAGTGLTSALAPTLTVESRLTVSAAWMRSSFENAQLRLPVQDFLVKGFRPGKAPKNLLEKKRAERALELAQGWVLDDLRRIIGESLDVLVIGAIGAPVSVEWSGTTSALTATFSYDGWIYPRLDLEELCRHIGPGRRTAEELSDLVYEFASSRLIPPGIEHALMRTTELREALAEDTATSQRHLRQALANNLLALALGIEVTSEDVDQTIGEYAIEHSIGFLEAKEELTPILGVYIQRIETGKAYAQLNERLAG